VADDKDNVFQPLAAYEAGLRGYIDSARERGLFGDSQKQSVYYEPNTMGSGEGQRAALWAYTQKLDPLSFTEVQTTGDCTSHCSRNAIDTTRATQICIENQPESFVVRSATEPTYGARGHAGEGMSPARAAMFVSETGFLLRKKYDAVDLAKYSSSIGTRWGSGGVPEEVKSLCRNNKVGVIRQLTRISDAVDALFNGYAIASGQFASWSQHPSKDHIHPRTAGGWSHAMATVGMDFTRKFWPFDVFFIQNSWGGWNQPPKEWPTDLPPWVPGMIVTKAEDWEVCVRGGDCYAYGNVDGFPPQKLPDYGAIGLLQT
jgi:hypothetical protein